VPSEKEDKWKASEQAKRDQTELIRGMAAVQKQQEDRLRAISHDLEQAVRYAHELHTEV
jgi:ABC-type cobalamin/Fe3+-siderophores transport system ATPase subunit